MKLLVTLRDSTNQLENFTVKFRVLENSLADKWSDLLIKNFFLNEHPIEKVFCLQGWQTDLDSNHGRSMSYLCQRLNESIAIINDDLNNKGYEYIDLHFDLITMKNSQASRNLLNQIHHHFEILIGQVWNPSKWYGLAEERTRSSIRNLNNICHEMEGILRFTNDPNCGCGINVGLNGPDFSGKYFAEKIKVDLEKDDYDHFQDYLDWGDCVIYYSQLGKRHIEAYNDKDDCIHDENISGYRFLTGEFILCFREVKKQSPQFFEWLKSKGFDPNDKTLGLGYPVVAKLESFKNKKEIERELKLRDDLYSIELQDDLGKRLYFKVYPYTWLEQENIIK